MDTAELPPPYLRGIALFNAGEFYACHEVLEEMWQQAAGDERVLLHALIQTAAALHHYQRGNLKGAASIYARARRKLAPLPAAVLGLSLSQLTGTLEAFFSAAFAPQSSPLTYPIIQLQEKN